MRKLIATILLYSFSMPKVLPERAFFFDYKNFMCQDICLIKNDKKSIEGEEFLYNLCINHIKKYESFSEEKYFDNDSSVSVGFGHHILSEDYIGENITINEADSLLKADFDKFIKISSKYVTEYHKKLALGMFLYNLGETKFVNSKLRRLIESNEPIDDEIIKWVHFRKNGVKVKSKSLMERRVFELSVWNKKYL